MYVLSPLLVNLFLAAAVAVVLVQFQISQDDTILEDQVHLEYGDWGEGEGSDPASLGRRAAWGMNECVVRTRLAS